MQSTYSLLVSVVVALGLGFPGCLFDGGNESDVDVWMSIAPIQCQMNSWEQEGKTIEAFLDDRGVDVLEIETSTFADAVCLACTCPDGQRVDVLVNEDDVETMLSEGFVRAGDWPY